jgi:hypothetical protein
VPVDPWGPLIAKEATAARKAIVQGIKTLQSLGAKVIEQRTKARAQVSPSVDPELAKIGKDSKDTG